MTTNNDFLSVVRESFRKYLESGTSRSTAKLKNLHGSIAADIKECFGDEYTVSAQGIGNGKEKAIEGRYYPKKVDIVVSRSGKPVAGFAVKFIMRNYSQNSNNYFENMLGETANIRSNAIPYYQIFIVFDKIPYYKKNGILAKYETLSEHHLKKYFSLSKDNPSVYMHTPEKTLLVILKLKEKEPSYPFESAAEYADYYLSVINDGDLLSYSDAIRNEFESTVILNDYEKFIRKTYHLTEGRTE